MYTAGAKYHRALAEIDLALAEVGAIRGHHFREVYDLRSSTHADSSCGLAEWLPRQGARVSG